MLLFSCTTFSWTLHNSTSDNTSACTWNYG